jgi:hypothetical protein
MVGYSEAVETGFWEVGQTYTIKKPNFRDYGV